MNARAVGAALLVVGLVGCRAGEKQRPAEPAPEAAEFSAICRGFRESEHLFYGEQSAARLEARLAEVEAGRVAVPPERRERIVLALASEWIELGRLDDALALLARTQSGAPVPEASAPVGPAANAGPPTFDAAVPGSAADDPAILRLTLERDAHLQAAEDMNCLLNHSAAACILPFRPEAIHKAPEHARRAAELSLAILERRPDSVSARWLLNLMRMVTDEYPGGVPAQWRLPEQAFAAQEDFPRWRDRAPDVGVNVSDLAGGAVMDDFDGDGLLDLVSSTANPCDHLKAFRSDGRGGFEDVSAAWGLDAQLGGLNLIHGDYDGDGALDLLVLRGGWLGASGRVRMSLLRNALASEGRFVDATRAAGLAEPAYPTQTAAFADFDGDGDLDLYVGHEAWTDRPYPSRLFRNEGGGTFRDVAESAGVAHPGFVKGVAWGDIDDDGDPDLYVSCIGPNHLYRNDGQGRFSDVTAQYGVEEPKGRSFATWFFDVDNDGRLDLFVADYGAAPEATMASYFGQRVASGHPLVYHNEGGRFRDVSEAMGLTRPLLPMGANYGDLDNDGWPDVYLGTGNPGLASLVPNAMYRNRGGARFVDVSFAGGFAHLQKGHGVAFGDIDGDGDQDLFHQLGGFYPADDYANALFENPGSGARWITLRLVGRRANRFGVGARIAVRVRENGGARTIHALAGSGGSFGGSSLQQEIGLGAADAVEEIRIRWPGSGTEQVFRDVAPDRVYVADEGEDALREVPQRSFALGANGAPRHGHP